MTSPSTALTEVDVGTLALLKGRGGALLREKIIASASEQLIIVVDETKLVDRLGVKSPMAIEVVPFGWRATARRLRRLVTSLERRTTSEGAPFMTDGGHYILDCVCGEIENPKTCNGNWTEPSASSNTAYSLG